MLTQDELIPVTEVEAVELIRRSDRRPVSFAFGTGGMALKWKAGEPMPEAVRWLGLMRGVLNENMHGAGI